MSVDGREETAASRSNGYDRRHQIVEVARSLFEERGLAHTTVKDIARESGVARGLFYYYFADKDAVIVEKQQSAVAAIRTALSKAPKQGSCP